MKVNKLKIHDQEEHENDELWAISYGDMITLLLSFFVIFFSTDFKKNRQEELDNHFMTTFKTEMLKQKSISPPTTTNPGSGKENKDAPKFDLLKNGKITKIDDRMVVTFENMMFFHPGDTDPTTDGASAIKEFAEKYLPYASMYKISIKAFTDKQQVNTRKHRYKDNMELSALRAIATLRILQKAGIPINRMEIAGYGEMNLLVSIIGKEKFEHLNDVEILNLSRTIMIIIKHDNERNLL